MAPLWADRSPECRGELIWRTQHQRNDPYGGLVPSHIATAGDLVRLGQYAGRQLVDDSRGAKLPDGGNGQTAVDNRRNPRARPSQPARSLSTDLWRALGRGARHLSRPIPRDP